ncbi:MAG: helix-turn-helix domain-containing protein [Chloroflexota bacterium]|nr:helix-turn-helix domain-containing protein [Chloroflexota bacterium]
MTNPHSGTDFDDFLRDENLYERVTERALIRVVAWQLKQEMEAKGITKVEMAARMDTSRSQLDRILNGDDEHVGRKLIVELV